MLNDDNKVMLVVCLPYRMPDNVCFYAAKEATRLFEEFFCVDAFSTTQDGNQLRLGAQAVEKFETYINSVIYQV